jgi:VCBS repeat-containing protein
MAASTTVKVATLTGAAKDDILSSAATGLTEDAVYSNLNVLANDPGSAKLYSLLQDTSGLSSTTQFPVVNTATLASGAKITINADGTVGYDASALKGALQSLAEGETFTDTFSYTIRMANGALSTAKVTVSIAGENDAPTLAGVSPVSIHDTAAIDNPAPLAGQLAGADVDHGAVLTYGFADGNGGTTRTSDYGTLTLDPATGSYSFAADAAKLNALAEGESATVSFTVQVTDEHGAKAAPVTLTYNLVGANDAPTLGAVDAATINDTNAIDNPAPLAGQLAGADVDHGAVLTYGFADGNGGTARTSDYGTLTLDPATGSYSFAADAAKLNALAEGESATVSFTVQVTDEHGAKAAPVTLTYNLVGANDAPTLAAVDAATINDTSAADNPAPLTGKLAGADVDHGAVLTYSFADGNGGTVRTSDYGTLTLDPATGSYSFAANAAKLDALAEGESATASFTVQVTDEHGAQAAPVTLTYNLVGANDIATISGTDTGAVTEDGTLTANGTVTVADRDAGQSVFQAPASLTGTYGDFTFNASTGAWTYALRNGDANVQALATGQTVHDQLVVKSLDGTATDTIVVSIGGADEPVVPTSGPSNQPPTVGSGNGTSDNPQTKFLVNYGQTDVNGKQIINNFDSNDLLAFTNNYTLQSISLVDTNGDGVKDSADAVFVFTHGNTSDPVEVVLVGYTGLTSAQIVHV